MDECSGEDLLNVLNDVNVNTQGVTNVIRGWFDTDDKDMKNLLRWICNSLSEENYVSPLELAEFSKLQEPLVGQAYEQEIKYFEERYPGIFDPEANELEIDLLQDEIAFMLEEERQLDQQLKINEALQHNLSKDLENATSEETKTALLLTSTEELCNSLGGKLDEVNERLHEQLVKYGLNLHDFEFGSVPKFLNNMNIKECQMNVDKLVSFLNPLLETELCPIETSKSVTGIENEDCCSYSVNVNDSIANSLNTMKNRILHSHQNYIAVKIDVQKARETLNYLNKIDLNAVIRCGDSTQILECKEYKEESKQRMSDMLKDQSAKLAERHVSEIKLKYAQQELQLHQKKLERLKRIEENFIRFISQFYLLSIMYTQEKDDIEKSDKFFRKILKYITEDLYSCEVRTEKMNKIISEYEDANESHLGEKFKMIKSIMKILTDDQDFDLYRSLEAIGEFRAELNRLEVNLFSNDFNKQRKKVDEIRENVTILQSFLSSGPTHRIILIPSQLQRGLRQIDDLLKKQVDTIKSAVTVSSSMKKLPNKWQNYHRQLWMYFYTDPKKMFLVLQEVEEELKKSKTNGIQK